MSEETTFETLEALGTGDRVELTFPARGDLIVLARLVTAVISSRAGFDIEELEDLRLAVGELCLLALQGSDPSQGDLQLEFTVTDDAFEVVCTLLGATSAAEPLSSERLEVDELGEQILAALVDDYGRERHDGAVKAWLRKHRRGHVA
jgi:serine/threonine-protein kinase RsbW